MIKKTLYFGNPIYLSLRNAQLVLRKPDADKLEESFKQDAERTIPVEDIGVVVLDNRRITITTGAMEALLNFLQTVGANVVSYFICKFIDKFLKNEER